MKTSQTFTHRPSSKVTLLHDPWPETASHNRAASPEFWRHFLRIQKELQPQRGRKSGRRRSVPKLPRISPKRGRGK